MKYLTEGECLVIASKILGKNLVSRGKTKDGVSSYVLEFETDEGQKYFFKQGSNNYLLQERICRLIDSQGLKTPEIIQASENFLIVKGVVGEPMKEVISRKEKLDIAENFGEYLAKLHRNQTTGWGDLVDIKKGTNSSYLEFYSYLFPFVEPKIQVLVESVLRATNQSCLNHGDTGSTHIFTDRVENFWGMIDFDDILSAPNTYDLAEFHGGIDGDFELWNRMMTGYTRFGKPVNVDSIDFLINEYLIFLDSWVWYKNKNDKSLEENLNRDAKRISVILDRIKNLYL